MVWTGNTIGIMETSYELDHFSKQTLIILLNFIHLQLTLYAKPYITLKYCIVRLTIQKRLQTVCPWSMYFSRLPLLLHSFIMSSITYLSLLHNGRWLATKKDVAAHARLEECQQKIIKGWINNQEAKINHLFWSNIKVHNKPVRKASLQWKIIH